MKAKAPKVSKVENTYLVLPEHTNAMGNIFGGRVMAWIDMIGSISAFRHCRAQVVTAGMDQLDFLYPVYLGELLSLKAIVNFTSQRSVEVGVKVIAENPITGEERHTATAYLTFVSLDEQGQVQDVPQVLPKSADEKRRFSEGKKRRAQRLKNKKSKD